MIRIFSVVYGDAFCKLFNNITLRSLLRQPLNASVAAGVLWSIYTLRENEEQIRSIMSLHASLEINFIDLSGGVSDVLHRCLIAEAKKCFSAKATMIMAPPDSFWGDGSLPNLIAMAGNRADLCVLAPHVRVEHEPFLQALPEGVLANPQLVSLALSVLHRVWRECDPDQSMLNTPESGHTLRKLPVPGHYAVCHLLPTPYLARFTEADIVFLESLGGDSWDHRWPAVLADAGRQRVIGSSDGFFLAELTNPATHFPPMQPCREFEDAFNSEHSHNKINRNMFSIWRAG
jgi:hypothetical protein